MKKSMKRVLSLVIAASVLTGNLLSGNLMAMAEEQGGVEAMLSTMTKEELQALSLVKLAEENQGLMLAEDVDLTSNAVINVIVEFNNKPVKVAKAQAGFTGYSFNLAKAEELVAEDHRLMEKHLQGMFQVKAYSNEANYIEHSYKEVFNGMSVNVPSNRVKDLLKCESVKAVYSNEQVSVNPIMAEEEKVLEVGNVDSPELRVKELHEAGITGEGIKVGVIDTGIDYNHPDLKDAYKGGYDFVDNDNDPMETTYQDWKNSGLGEKDLAGSTYYTQHGTHVSGIIAGQGDAESDLSKTGVAPDADLYAYRVLGSYGTGYTSDILAGIEKAVQDGMDVINLSLGANRNDHLYPTSIAVNNAVLSGVVAVVAAGNSGPGPFTLGSPGAASLALTVGASTLDVVIPTAEGVLTTDAETKYDLRLMARNIKDKVEDLNNIEAELIDVGAGGSYNYNGKDVTGKYVIIERGGYTLDSLVVLAKQKGAAGVILQNNNVEEGHIQYYLGEDSKYVPTFSISKAQGDILKSKLQEDAKLVINSVGQIVNEGDTLGSFSSTGPTTISYDIKPEVVAPGVSISSTIPWYMDGTEADGTYDYAYKKLSGTSMAAPYASGVAALVLQQNEGIEPIEVKTRIMNTSDPLNEAYSVYQVGAGRIDPYEAVNTAVHVKVEDKVAVDNSEDGTRVINDGDLNYGIIMNSNADFQNTRKVLIENKSGEDKTFNIQTTINEGVGIAVPWGENGVSLAVDTTVTVGAGASESLDVTINVPKTANIGAYEGYLVLTNANNPEEVYRVPFGVNKFNQGNGDIYLDVPMFATPKGYYSRTIVGSTSIFFNVQVPMESIDFYVVDGNTDKTLGWVGNVSPASIVPSYTYRLDGFSGDYRPSVEGEAGEFLAYESETLNTGNYKLRMVGVDLNGGTYSNDFSFYIDNELPAIEELSLETVRGTITLDKQVIYELEPGETTLTLNGKFFDADLQKIIDAGIDPYSRWGYENYYKLSTTGVTAKAETQRDGTVTATLTPPSRNTVSQVEIQGIDAVGNTSINDVKAIYIVKSGTPYVEIMPGKTVFKGDETPTHELSVKNAQDLKELEFKYRVKATSVELKEFNLLPEYEDKGTLEYITYFDEQGNYQYIEGKIIFNEPVTASKEGIKVAEISLNNLEHWDNNMIKFYGDVAFVNSSGQRVSAQNCSIPYKRESAYVLSRFRPYWAEGLTTLTPAGIYVPTLGEYYDYNTIGLNSYVQDAEGNTFESNFNNISNFMHTLLPFENKEYKAVIDIPGHFTVYRDFMVDRVDQIKMTYYFNINFERAIAGDVNKDDVIDINDALFISDNFLKDTRAGDINFDGVVDNKDLEFVINNFGLQNPTAATSPEPVYESQGVTIDDVAADLEDGIVNLRLQLLINQVKGLDGTIYTEETWEQVEKALDNAVKVNENPEATQQEVDEAKVNLEEAVKGLVKAVVKTHLQLAVTEAEKISKEELNRVVPAVVEEFTEALEEAQRILLDKEATQEQVDGSWTRLTSVMQKLSFYKGDKTSLLALIDEISKLKQEEFFTAPWLSLQAVLAEANAVVADENAMEKEVNEVYEKLMKAFLDLRLLPNKDKLQELINAAESLDKSKYTEESLIKLTLALNNAKAVLENREAEEAEVTKAVNGLQLAMESLVERESNNGDNDENSGNENNNGGNNNGNNSALPQTGGAAGSGMMTMASILASAAGVVLLKRKREE